MSKAFVSIAILISLLPVSFIFLPTFCIDFLIDVFLLPRPKNECFRLKLEDKCKNKDIMKGRMELYKSQELG